MLFNFTEDFSIKSYKKQPSSIEAAQSGKLVVNRIKPGGY